MADIFRKQFNAERYRWIMHRLNELKAGDVKKTCKEYRLLKTYEISTSTIQDTVVHNLVKSGTN